MKKNLFGIFTCFACVAVNSQQVVTTDETHNGTTLTITMDSRTASALTAMETNCTRSTTASRNNDVSSSETGSSFENIKSPRTAPARKLTTAEICSRNPKISGYKIQVAVVKSNEEANAIKVNFRKMFPRLKVETDASLRPNYKILAGSYFSRESASGDLKQIKSTFKEAVAVQRTIYCVEGK